MQADALSEHIKHSALPFCPGTYNPLRGFLRDIYGASYMRQDALQPPMHLHAAASDSWKLLTFSSWTEAGTYMRSNYTLRYAAPEVSPSDDVHFWGTASYPHDELRHHSSACDAQLGAVSISDSGAAAVLSSAVA